MSIKSFLKRRLPKSIVSSIKRARFARKIGSLTEQSDIDFKGIRHLVSEGDEVVDIGANMGYFTKYFSDVVGKTGIVYSIEPIPDSYELLQYIAQKLNLHNVNLINCAISNANEVVTMEIPISNAGEENLFEAKITPTAVATYSRTVTVSTRTLDSLIPWKGKNVSFIKCDVEGHEFQCLEGAVSLIKRSHPAWLIEIWGDLDELHSQARQTVDFLKKLGYEAYLFDGSLFRARKKGERDVNYFFLTKAHIGMLQHKNLLQTKQ